MKSRITLILTVLVVIILTGCAHIPAQTTGTTAMTINGTKAPMPASVLVGALTLAGMPITNVIDCNGQTDPDELVGLPGQYTFKAIFSLPADHGEAVNAVEVFMSDEDASARFASLESAASISSQPVEYHYLSGKYILRLSPNTLPADAARYQGMFLKIVGH
jgi:hypothetical protein